MDLRIVGLDRFTIELPFREVPARNMMRELPDFTFFEIFRVKLHGGAVGIGEAMHFYYPWGQTSDDVVKRVWNQQAHEVMWDDAIGFGLQIALFDAVGQALGLPVHALLGKQVRDRAGLSWWAIDMPPEDWASECQAALNLSYRDFKTKGRPWHDIYAQMDTIAKVVPADFQFDIDFNATLLDAEHAVPILQGLEAKYRNFAICESPIPQDDVAGGKRIQEAVKVPIAHHYGGPPVNVQIRENLCNGFVLTGGASELLRQGRVCEEFDKPFWLQQVGSGLTAAFSLHLAAVLSRATWPAVNCHQLYARDALAAPIEVRDGTAAVPDSPGLGVAIDEDALQQLRLPAPYQGFNPKRLIEVAWPNGARFYYSTGNQLWRDAQAGNMPVFITGVKTRLMPDDGSTRWRDLHAQALKTPVREGTAGPRP